MPQSVRIVAPSRIHFGLLSIDKSDVRYFGGVGAMLEEPCLELVVSRETSANRSSGPLTDRAEEFIASWQATHGISDPVHCEVEKAPPQHVGLGLGTQLGLSIGTALNRLFEVDTDSVEDLARSVGRGRRSAVGTWGFVHGGFILDEGKANDDELGRLGARIEVPADWCVVLLRPDQPQGLAGNAEVQAFGQLAPVRDELKRRIRCELFDRMIPAATQGDFPTFAESVYEYGYAAGEMFASEQGGPFRSAEVAEMVTHVRSLGVPGVGQSSWGPTLFCWFPNRETAEAFAVSAQDDPNLPKEVIVSSVARHGARIVVD